MVWRRRADDGVGSQPVPALLRWDGSAWFVLAVLRGGGAPYTDSLAWASAPGRGGPYGHVHRGIQSGPLHPQMQSVSADRHVSPTRKGEQASPDLGSSGHTTVPHCQVLVDEPGVFSQVHPSQTPPAMGVEQMMPEVSHAKPPCSGVVGHPRTGGTAPVSPLPAWLPSVCSSSSSGHKGHQAEPQPMEVMTASTHEASKQDSSTPVEVFMTKQKRG